MSRIGVVTVTFNSEPVLQPFLRCCLAQRGVDVELLVVDNASVDGTRRILAGIADPRVQCVLNEANLGFAKASNQGITHFLERGFDRVLLINNDTEFPAELLAGLDGLLDKHRGRVITPRITYFDRPELNWYCGGRFTPLRGMTGYHERWALPDSGEREEIRHVEYAPACCLMVDRSVFEEVGLLDERFFVYWEDGDFCMRLKRAHVPLLYAPGLVLAHKASALTGGQTSDFTIRQYHKNQMYFVRKHFGPAMLAYTFALMVLKSLLRVMFRGDTWRQFRLRMRSMAEGLRNTAS